MTGIHRVVAIRLDDEPSEMTTSDGRTFYTRAVHVYSRLGTPTGEMIIRHSLTLFADEPRALALISSAWTPSGHHAGARSLPHQEDTVSDFQVCMCGAAPGYPHAAYCPYPCFWTDERSCREWERARDDIGRPTRIPETLDPPTEGKESER